MTYEEEKKFFPFIVHGLFECLFLHIRKYKQETCYSFTDIDLVILLDPLSCECQVAKSNLYEDFER